MPMKRSEQHARNHTAITRAMEMIESGAWPHQWPSYAQAVATLNAEGYRTSRDRPWTRRALYRMLQREGIAGIHDLAERCEKGHYLTRKKGVSAPYPRAHARLS